MASSSPSSKRPRPPSPSPSPATPPVDGRDLLDSLPRELVDEILCRLPVEDAVRTSILSRPWRYRWASCPGLRFEFLAGDGPAGVDAVLAAYACPFSDFLLQIPRESVGKAGGWLRALANKGVRSLDLSFFVADEFSRLSLVPAPLFSCRELTSLVLHFCHIGPLPSSFQGFPNLAKLKLDEVTLPKHGEKTMEALIARSPLLIALYIVYPAIDKGSDGRYDRWVIQAPKVKTLEISSHDDYGWHIEELPSLEQGRVVLEGPQLLRILSGMTTVKKLSIDLTYDGILQHQPSYFLDLKDVLICAVFSQSSRILSILYLLRSSPNLENLHITIMHEYDENIEVGMEFLSTQWIGLFSKLNSVRLDAIMGHSHEMQFLEFLLSKAILLRKVEVSVHNDSIISMEVVSSKLSNYEKASSQAEVIVNTFLGYYGKEADDDDESEADD